MNRDLDTDQAQDYFFSLSFNETVLFLSNYRRDFYLESKRSRVKICVNTGFYRAQYNCLHRSKVNEFLESEVTHPPPRETINCSQVFSQALPKHASRGIYVSVWKMIATPPSIYLWKNFKLCSRKTKRREKERENHPSFKLNLKLSSRKLWNEKKKNFQKKNFFSFKFSSKILFRNPSNRETKPSRLAEILSRPFYFVISGSSQLSTGSRYGWAGNLKFIRNPASTLSLLSHAEGRGIIVRHSKPPHRKKKKKKKRSRASQSVPLSPLLLVYLNNARGRDENGWLQSPEIRHAGCERIFSKGEYTHLPTVLLSFSLLLPPPLFHFTELSSRY